MDQAQLNWLTNFIWNIADDVLRDVYVRGKYRDVILPMTVLRRLDAVLEPTKKTVLEMKEALDREGVTNQDDALRAASGQAFYNTSPFLLRDLKSRATQQKLRDDFEVYLDGFSPNVQDILTNFEFRNQIPRLSKADALGQLIEKFLDKDINLSPQPDGNLPGLDNHSMGTMFEELVRRFNEDNNEEAGEHWTPRDAVRLMANLMFLPVADKIESGTYLLYDCACGTGGMLTVAEETLQQIAKAHGKEVATHLYGQEINGETYAICKADLLLKGDGDAADNIVGGPEHSTLANDAFRSREFDFMLANPPYGKSWKSDLERMGGKKDLKDPRFVIQHAGESDYSLLTRSSDGQMLFLANMLSKMKHDTPLGSRIAEVHNGSSLFTGDAGQGESNIRRWIIENDWLEAIVALPLNMFYNTGIATYVWVLTNRKPEHRLGKVQLIDATQWFRPLRKNMGKKNCELAPEDIQRICDTFLKLEETPQSKIFPNAAFGYWKVKVERPLRLHSQLTRRRIETLRFASGDEEIRAALYEKLGDDLFEKPQVVREELAKLVASWGDAEAGDDEENGDGTAKKGLPEKTKKKLLDADTWKRDAALVATATKLRDILGDGLFEDHNVFLEKMDAALKKLGIKPGAADRKLILAAVSWRDESAAPVIKKVHKPGKTRADPLHGLYQIDGGNGSPSRPTIIEYEPDSELRDYEQIPLMEEGGIEAFIRREVLPYTPDAWIVEADTKIGYEVSFTRHFYQPPQLRTLAEISADILALEQETEGLLQEITKGANPSRPIKSSTLLQSKHPSSNSVNPILISPEAALSESLLHQGGGRFYARHTQTEGISDIPGEKYPAIWILEAFDQSWFDSNPLPEQPEELDNFYQSARLFLLEVVIKTPGHPLLRAINHVHLVEENDEDPDAWFVIEAEHLGTVPRGEDVPMTIYGNLYLPGVSARLASAEPATPETAAKLKRAVSTEHIPSATTAEVDEVLAQIATTKVDWAIAYDVGQGTSIGLCNKSGSVSAYFDLGGGVLANTFTFPTALSKFCFTEEPPIILSHWDFDHWSSANRDPRAFESTWIAPRQAVGPIHVALMERIRAVGHLMLLPATFPSAWRGQLYLELCNGRGRNHSGIALTLSERPGGNGEKMLFPGDARYTCVPSFSQTTNYLSVVVPHHGADMRNRMAPVGPTQNFSRLAYSYGKDNTFDHPRRVTRIDHASNGWRDPAINHGVAAFEVRETANRDSTGLGHILLGWSSHSVHPRLPCGALQCQLQAKQL